MAEKSKEDRRSRVGYGSTYRKGFDYDLDKTDGIGAVLGGQVWQIKPDREARAANPCIFNYLYYLMIVEVSGAIRIGKKVYRMSQLLLYAVFATADFPRTVFFRNFR